MAPGRIASQPSTKEEVMKNFIVVLATLLLAIGADGNAWAHGYNPTLRPSVVGPLPDGRSYFILPGGAALPEWILWVFTLLFVGMVSMVIWLFWKDHKEL